MSRWSSYPSAMLSIALRRARNGATSSGCDSRTSTRFRRFSSSPSPRAWLPMVPPSSFWKRMTSSGCLRVILRSRSVCAMRVEPVELRVGDQVFLGDVPGERGRLGAGRARRHEARQGEDDRGAEGRRGAETSHKSSFLSEDEDIGGSTAVAHRDRRPGWPHPNGRILPAPTAEGSRERPGILAGLPRASRNRHGDALSSGGRNGNGNIPGLDLTDQLGCGVVDNLASTSDRAKAHV